MIFLKVPTNINVFREIIKGFVSFLQIRLQSSTFPIGIIRPVGDDDMVEEVESHQFTGVLQFLRDAVVFLAGPGVVAGMVMTECNGGSVVEEGRFDDQSDIHGSFCESTA